MTSTPANVFTLTDRAIVVYFVLKECGMLTATELCVKLNKSPASIYRAISDLRESGIIKATRERPVPLPETHYTINEQSDFTKSNDAKAA